MDQLLMGKFQLETPLNGLMGCLANIWAKHAKHNLLLQSK
jgi:hypothetical protein